MVCTIPMFRAVKKAYPDCKVYVVGTAINEQVVAGNPDIDGYVVWSNDVKTMAKKIRGLNCDFGCTTSPNFLGLAALYLSGIPLIAVPKVMGGFSPTETRACKMLRALVLLKPHEFESYAPREYLRLLELIDIHTADTKKYAYFSSNAEQSVASKLREAGIKRAFAIIAPGAGNKIKRWPAERWAQVADYIAQKYAPVIIVGGIADREDVATVMEHAQDSRINDFSEKVSIDELKALISRAALFVSVDTGPLYIAEAFDVPTIDLVGPVSEKDQPPNRPPKHVVIVPPRDKPALYAFNGRTYDAEEVRQQAYATQTEEVLRAIDTTHLTQNIV
jgi:ADP-heptose:LPS heptosyltransferase